MSVSHHPPSRDHLTHLLTAKITQEQHDLHAHLRIVGLVGSIDNDMCLTDLTIGAPTALQRICESIDNINSTAYSHSRAFVIEVMGRDCGWLALMAGVAYVFPAARIGAWVLTSGIVVVPISSSSPNVLLQPTHGRMKCVLKSNA